MQTLDISQINILAPYPVWYEGEEILFKTDYNILYSVAFELDDMLGLTAYWFRITNRSGKKASPQCLAPFLQLEVRIEQNVVFQIFPQLGGKS